MGGEEERKYGERQLSRPSKLNTLNSILSQVISSRSVS